MLSESLLAAPRWPALEPPPPPAPELLDAADEPPPPIAVPTVASPIVKGEPRAAQANHATPAVGDGGHAAGEGGPKKPPPPPRPVDEEAPDGAGGATEVAVAAHGESPAQPPPVAPATPGAVAEHVRHAARAQHGIAPPAQPAAQALAQPPAPASADVGSDVAGEDAPSAPAQTLAAPSEISTPPVRFASGGDAERTDAAHARVDAFTDESRLRISSLRGTVDAGARSLVPRLAAAEQAIDAAKQQNQRGVVAAMAELRQQTEAKVRDAGGEIVAHHGRTLAAIRGATAAAQAQLDGQVEAALAAVLAGEAKHTPEIDVAYAAGDARFHQSGEKVGQEALAVGAEYRRSWMSQLDGESTLLSGPVHDSKLKARAKAADQVAEAFHKELVASAGKQADAAKAGKAHDREALSAAAAAHRDAILGVQRDAHAGLAHAESTAIDAANGQRDRDLQLLAAQHVTTLGTIARKERELGREVVRHAAGQKRALRGFVESAVSQCLAGIRGIGEAFDGSIRDLRARAATTAAPHVDELEPSLAGQSGRLSEGAAATEAKLREALASAEQQIAMTQDQSVQGLGGLGAMVGQAAGQIGASIAQTVAAFARHSSEGFASVEKGHAESARGVVAGAVRASHDIAASSTTAFSGLIGNLHTGIDKGAVGLEANLRGALKDLRPQIEKSAEEAAKQVQPRWKKVLKVLAVVAVIVVVAVVAGPAVIGAVGAMAGALGASAAVAGAIGTIVGGAVVGAASGAVLQITNNVIDGNKWYEGVGTAMAMGAISGVFGGVGGLAAKGLTSAAIRTLVTMGFDTAGSVVANLATGQPVTLEGLAVGLAIGVGVSVGTGALRRFGGRLGKKFEAPAVEEHVLEVEADTLAGERPSANTPDRAPPKPLEITEVDDAQIPKYEDPREPVRDFSGEDIELDGTVPETFDGPTVEMPKWDGEAARPSPRSESADYMKEQLPPTNEVETKVKPPKVTAFGGDEPTVEMPAVKPGGDGPPLLSKKPSPGDGAAESAVREASLDDVLDALEAEHVGTPAENAAEQTATFEELETRLQSETDPQRRLEIWRELHARRATRAAADSIDASRNDSSLTADQQQRRIDATTRIHDSTLSELDEEIAHLQTEWHLRSDEENLARANELIERKSLEHQIETRYNVNLTNDLDMNAGSVHPDYQPTTRATWSIDELRSIDAGLSRVPPEHILGNRHLPPRVSADGRWDSRMPGLEIRRAQILRVFRDGSWQERPASSGAQAHGVIRLFDGVMEASGHNVGLSDALAGHEAGGSGAHGPTTGAEDVVVHEIGHDVEASHGRRGADLASAPGSVSEAFRAAGGWGTTSMTRAEAFEMMVAAPPAGYGLPEPEALAQLHVIDWSRGMYQHYETPRYATGDRVLEANLYDEAGYVTRARNALPEANHDQGYWTYARSHPAESFAEQYSAAVHSPMRYHKDMIETPAKNLACAKDNLVAAKAGVAAARSGAEAQRAQAQLAEAQTLLDRAQAAQTARCNQYDMMRNTIFRTDAAARAAEARLAATPVSAGREAERAARIARFRNEVEVAATPQQVERLRAQAEADIRVLQ